MQFKFRAWDIGNSHMLSWEEIQNEWESEGYFYNIFEQDHYKTMQFSNFVDICGKEIYDGDIVTCYNSINKPIICKVVFDKGAFLIRCGKYDMSLYEYSDVKIIGNVYENQTLINEL